MASSLLVAATPVGAHWSVVGVFWVALLGAIISFWAIISQRSITRRLATLQLLTESEADVELIDARQVFIELANSKAGLHEYGARDKLYTKEGMAIRMVLNELELVSIGIQRGVLEYEFIKRWSRSTILKYYAAAKPFIARVEQDAPPGAKYYQELKVLCDWLDGKQEPRRRRFWALFF